MATFTFTTNNINEAVDILIAIAKREMDNANSVTERVTPIQTGTETVIETPTESVTESVIETTNETSVSSNELTPTEIQGVIDGLVNMSKTELTEMFGDGNDKPYRVIKNVGLRRAKELLGITAHSLREVHSSLESINAAIQLIIKDVSVGGLSHDDMENMFGVRTSKNLFKENTLDEIVETLTLNNFI